MRYYRLCNGISDRGILVDASDHPLDHITNVNTDWYQSVFYYNESQYKIFQQKGTIAGITEVITDKLVWDFDSKAQPENARKDAIELCARLIGYGLPEEAIRICFSGNKGFSIEVHTTSDFSVEDFKNVNISIAKNLGSNDLQILNASRIFRVPMTRHQTSHLFKIPLTLSQLSDLPVSVIKEHASSLDSVPDDLGWTVVDLPASILSLCKPSTTSASKAKVTSTELAELDFTKKQKWLSNCKFSILNGHFTEGMRHSALLALASTFKNQGFPKEVTYRILKGAVELSEMRNDTEPYSKDDLWNNVVKSVYSDTWNGGQYSCKSPGWLKEYCDNLGPHKCKHADQELPVITFGDVTGTFLDYVNNIEKNTIKTGIASLDKNIFLSTGCNVGIVGAPASGKSSLALNLLNNTSKAGIKSVFASLDMHRNRMFEKIMYKLSGGVSRENLYGTFKKKEYDKLIQKLHENFGNVYLFDRTMPTVASLKNYIMDCQEKSGEKIKLVMIDYFERIFSDISEDTAASKKIAGELQDMCLDLDICLVTLLQPNKMSGIVNDPILSYNNIKGSSFLAQSFRIILGIYREGYDPRRSDNDRYMTINTLKNDLGELASLDFYWRGRTGEIEEIDEEGMADLRQLRDSINERKGNKDGWD